MIIVEGNYANRKEQLKAQRSMRSEFCNTPLGEIMEDLCINKESDEEIKAREIERWKKEIGL